MTIAVSQFETDTVVIGAGVVGIAVARELARMGRSVIVIEAEDAIGTQTSARNSEVIHAGIYYPKDSLKAVTCVRGRHLLYSYLETHGIAHRKCGKLIVASTETQLEELGSIAQKARANGVDDLEEIDGAKAKAAEPALSAKGALVSPSTGIIDSHAYMLSLQGQAEDHGAVFAFGTRVTEGECLPDGRTRLDCSGDEPVTLIAKEVINCAGHGAPLIARSIEGLAKEFVPQPYLAKGNYFTLTTRAPFSKLIYPVPEPGGLGVHLTLDLGGRARFGPDVEWVDTVDYTVSPARGDAFYEAIRRYWPALPDGALAPDYSGIRPKISPAGAPAADFQVIGPDTHGTTGQVHLFGIESPGLTASLAIAERVAALLS